MDLHWAFISIGSNLGNRLQNCCQGLASLCADGSVTVVARSPFYETEPVDYLDQQWFLNAAAKIETALAPLALMDKMQSVQKAFGRKASGVRFGPRLLDLDIILYEAIVMHTTALTIPHARMHKRHFVLQPICDIDPMVVHPVLGLTAGRLLEQLTKEGQRIRPCSYDC